MVVKTGWPARKVERDFPHNVVSSILKHMRIKEIRKCACVSRTWNYVAEPIIRETNLKLEKAWAKGGVDPVLLDIGDNWETLVTEVVKKDNLIALGGEKLLRIWDVERKDQMIDCPMVGVKTIRTLCFFGDKLLTGDDEGKICAWDPTTGDFLFGVDAHPIVNVITKVGRVFASGGDDSNLKIWKKSKKRRKFRCKILKGHKGAINSLDTDGHADKLVSGSEDNTIRIWNVKACKCVKILHPEGVVWGVRFVDNHILCGTNYTNLELGLWEISSGRKKNFPVSENGMFTCYNARNGRILVGYAHGIVNMWRGLDESGEIDVRRSDDALGQEKCMSEFQVDSPVWDVWVGEDEFMVVSPLSGTIMLWDFWRWI